MKKRLLPLLLAVLLLCTLMTTAASASGGAYVVVLSTQDLTVNGRPIDCEKYNIDGANYFKLRDVAYLLNGTGSQFAVYWNDETNTVTLIPGQPYEPVGGELDTSGGDKSATAQRSPQTIMIGLEEASNLDVFNIGGNNYFKLRDLADALNFHVDYDEVTRTVLVVSVGEAPAQGGPTSTLSDGNYTVLFDGTTAEEAGGMMLGFCQVAPEGADALVDADGWLYFPDTLSVTGDFGEGPEPYENIRAIIELLDVSELAQMQADVTIHDGSVTACTVHPSM